jgi:hypothetical protein
LPQAGTSPSVLIWNEFDLPVANIPNKQISRCSINDLELKVPLKITCFKNSLGQQLGFVEEKVDFAPR